LLTISSEKVRMDSFLCRSVTSGAEKVRFIDFTMGEEDMRLHPLSDALPAVDVFKLCGPIKMTTRATILNERDHMLY
jgi:hypothetical protein